MDAAYEEILKAQGALRLDEVRRQNEHEAEKSQKLKEKLYKRLMENVLVELIPLSDLSPMKQAAISANRQSMVYSIRTRTSFVPRFPSISVTYIKYFGGTDGLDSAVGNVLNAIHEEEMKKQVVQARQKAAALLVAHGDSLVADIRSRTEGAEQMFVVEDIIKLYEKGTAAMLTYSSLLILTSIA